MIDFCIRAAKNTCNIVLYTLYILYIVLLFFSYNGILLNNYKATFHARFLLWARFKPGPTQYLRHQCDLLEPCWGLTRDWRTKLTNCNIGRTPRIEAFCLTDQLSDQRRTFCLRFGPTNWPSPFLSSKCNGAHFLAHVRQIWPLYKYVQECIENNYKRPVDALAVKTSITHLLTTWNQEMLAHLKIWDIVTFIS